jgi:hypothetical protein
MSARCKLHLLMGAAPSGLTGCGFRPKPLPGHHDEPISPRRRSNQPPNLTSSSTCKLLLTNSYISAILHVSTSLFESLESTQTRNPRHFCNFQTLIFEPPPSLTKPTTCTLFEKHGGVYPLSPFPISELTRRRLGSDGRKRISGGRSPRLNRRHRAELQCRDRRLTPCSPLFVAEGDDGVRVDGAAGGEVAGD